MPRKAISAKDDKSSAMILRHCEERSDEVIQFRFVIVWIALLRSQ
jgi:hypothetical protein